MSSSSKEERKMEEGRVEGGEEGEVKEVYYPRRNGWTCPWHPLQVLAWGFIAFFAATYFGFLVHYIPGAWRSIGYILGGGLFVTHIVSSLVASVVDPAEASVRRRKAGRDGGGFLRAVFDRKKHSHVIEDRFCNLCNISVTAGAKHCSVCDKCVEGFDHHCIWLNTCVGSRNYRWFLVTVFSALLACVLLLLFTVSLFVTFFAGRDRLRYNCKDHFVSANTSCCQDIGFFGATVPDAVFPTAVAVVGLLALVGVVMIGYLAGFHVYLNVRGLTTYDYVLLLRRLEKEREEARSREDQEAAGSKEEEDEKEEENGDATHHGRCWFLRRKQVNRVTPSGDRDVEKGQSSPAGGVVSASPSVDSVGLFNFGRTPAQSVVSSSVGDVSLDPVDSTAGALRGGGHWMYGEEQDSSQKEKSCRHEVVVEMEALPVPPGGVVSPGRSAVDRDVAKFGSGQGNSGVKDVERACEEKCDFENCGILASMSSANSIASGEEKEQATEDDDEYVENCGTLAFMTSANSVASSGVPTGVQITGGDGGERSVIVCDNDSPAVPDVTPGTRPTGTVSVVYATSNEGETARVHGGVEPSMSTEKTDLREKGYEMMIRSGNTVGIRALKQLSSFARQRSSAPENKTKDTPTPPVFHSFSYPLAPVSLGAATSSRSSRRLGLFISPGQ